MMLILGFLMLITSLVLILMNQTQSRRLFKDANRAAVELGFQAGINFMLKKRLENTVPTDVEMEQALQEILKRYNL
jgi:predicted double-glycine peptidase